MLKKYLKQEKPSFITFPNTGERVNTMRSEKFYFFIFTCLESTTKRTRIWYIFLIETKSER